MEKDELFDIVGKADEQKSSSAGLDMTAKRKLRPTWLKWGVMAVCLCLAVVGGALFYSNSANDLPLIVSQYKSVTSGQYPVPEPGEYFCFANVNDARKHYEGENVKYLLSFNMFKVDEEFLSDEEKKIEYQRLIGLGYELYEAERWTYQGEGEKLCRSVVVGLFSEEDLADFKINPAYGYAFYFVSNGDGSSISMEETDLITEFDIGAAD